MGLTSRRLAILAIGDELTIGERVDTNSAWIAEQAAAIGVEAVEHRTVSDSVEQIAGAMRDLCALTSVLVVTGGLGPTQDDLTRQALAQVLGSDLEIDEPSLRHLESWFDGRGRTMPDANRIQAMRPEKARCLANEFGTAPGLGASVGDCRVVCLPGPPREMKPMFKREAMPLLAGEQEEVVRVRTMPVFGLGESAVAELLGELMDRGRNPVVGTTASGCVVTCRVRYTGPEQEAESALQSTQDELRVRLGVAVLSGHDHHDDGHALVRAVSDLLLARDQQVATVESCTGGLLGEMITRVPGSSSVFAGGLLTYSNALKSRIAGVSEGLLAEHGAVSAPVASAMATGGQQATQADHALAITGVAGPDGGSESKPVGTVWISRASKDGSSDTRRFVFKGGREAVRLWSATTALGMLRLHLLGAEMKLLGQLEP